MQFVVSPNFLILIHKRFVRKGDEITGPDGSIFVYHSINNLQYDD
jgi:hypothetical protein